MSAGANMCMHVCVRVFRMYACKCVMLTIPNYSLYLKNHIGHPISENGVAHFIDLFHLIFSFFSVVINACLKSVILEESVTLLIILMPKGTV